ncbi:MAG: 1-deoxy-D-xylulose-5-phosphate synthase [Magnetococcales bacterium]|nr:1-deoxy-D-xylulose-5-phosphate synthase [Magnetococcales bacterium]
MRGVFIDTLIGMAVEDPRILLLTADLGFTLVESFVKRFPDRFFNVGVAEQNMVGMATGLAKAGFMPFIYSMVPFLCLRPLEFIRNGPVLHRLPVRLAGPGGGFEYGGDGLSHHGLEDIAVLRSLQDITIIAPADAGQARLALRASKDLPGPIYFRLGKDDQFRLPGLDDRFPPDGCCFLRQGEKILVVTTGSISREVGKAVELLVADGIFCTFLVLAIPHPPPVATLTKTLANHAIVLTVEEHVLAGGLGSIVAEIIAEHAIKCRLIRRGIRSAPAGLIGSRPFLLQRHGLDPESLVRIVKEAVRS